jgi:hypothetical protein
VVVGAAVVQPKKAKAVARSDVKERIMIERLLMVRKSGIENKSSGV